MTVNCWACGHLIELATAVDGSGRQPQNGDVSVCIGCGEPAVFTGTGVEQRQPTGEEMDLFNQMTSVIRARAVVLMRELRSQP